MDNQIKLLWGMFFCLLWFQAAMIMSYAHSHSDVTVVAVAEETSTEMPPVRMKEDVNGEIKVADDLPWGDLLELRNEFEAELLPDLNERAKTGEIKEGTMWRFIQSHFLENGVNSEEDAKKVAQMINLRIDWLVRRVSQDLRPIQSTSKKMAEVAMRPYRFMNCAALPIPGCETNQWGTASDYDLQRTYLRVMGVSEE